MNLNGRMYTLLEDIPQGHKFALEKISSGEAVIKYGSPIGYATEDIPAGSWIHTHNMKTGLGDLLNYSYQKSILFWNPQRTFFSTGTDEPMEKPVFETKSGSSPPLAVSTTLQRSLPKKPKSFQPESVDAIVAFPHPYGCSQMGDDQEHTRQILADLIRHPNAAGVLVLGLGCENSNIDD